MRITVNVEARSGRMQIRIPQADIEAEEPGLVAYDLTTEEGKFLAYGTDEQTLLNELTDKGYDQAQIGFLSVEGQFFNPHLAIWIINYYVRAASDRIRSDFGRLRLFDRWHYDIRISGYEDLPEDVCAQFEWELLEILKADRTSVINGERVRRLWWRHTVLDATLSLLYIILMLGLYGLTLWGVLKATGATGVLDSRRVPVWAIVIGAVSIFVSLPVSVMVSALLVGTIWALVKRRSFTEEGFWSHLLPKVVVRWVDQFCLAVHKIKRG